jgi:hypothetical protein
MFPQGFQVEPTASQDFFKLDALGKRKEKLIQIVRRNDLGVEYKFWVNSTKRFLGIFKEIGMQEMVSVYKRR